MPKKISNENSTTASLGLSMEIFVRFIVRAYFDHFYRHAISQVELTCNYQLVPCRQSFCQLDQAAILV
jgi:hypothetical protein